MTLSNGLRDREYGKFIDVGGETAVRSLIIGSITIGSVSAQVDSVYIQSGDNINLGTAWTGVGSVYVANDISVDFTDLGSTVVSEKGDTSYTKLSKTADRTTAGSTAIWIPTAGKKAIITDMIISNGSPAGNTIQISSAGSVFAKAILGEFGGFVSNMQTPVETQTNGSVWFVTDTITDITSASLAGYEI